jgi:hypothetical protein
MVLKAELTASTGDENAEGILNKISQIKFKFIKITQSRPHIRLRSRTADKTRKNYFNITPIIY